MPRSSSPPRTTRDRPAVDASPRDLAGLAWLRQVAIALAVVLPLAELLGATRCVGSWWGAHAWAFLPAGLLWGSLALVVLGLLLARLGGARLDRVLVGGLGAARRLPPWIGFAALAVITGGLCWLFREAHTLLGDGSPITRNLPQGQRFHPDEPLTLLLHHEWYRLTRPLFEGAGLRPEDVAHATVGLSSALCGAAFAPIAWTLVRDLIEHGGTRLERGGREENATLALGFAVLIAQGYVQLFFGYVENYTFVLLVLSAYTLAALRSLEGRLPLLVPAALLVLALALHLSAAVLGASFAVLVVRRLAEPAARAAAVRDLAITAALFAATHLALGRLAPGYDWTGMLLRLGRAATDSTSSYGFHTPNLGQFLNQQVLIGPLSVFLFAPALVAWMLRRRRPEVRLLFLLGLAAGWVVASLVAGDSNLGVARNWDLLAPAGFVFTLAALAIAFGFTWPAPALRSWLFALALVSLFHTVPWIAVNASPERAIERMKVLPLKHGRAQALVGTWYLEHGREREAAEWFRRSLDENPMNNLAAYQLGRIAMRHGDHAFAVQAFSAALAARPNVGQYRFARVDALARSGERARARADLDTLLALDGTHPAWWAAGAILWLEAGERPRALAALDSVERRAAGDPLLGELRAAAASDSAARTVFERVWPRLFDY